MKDVNSNALADAHRWKHLARWHGEGFFVLKTEDTAHVPVRLFLTQTLLESAEDILYRQIVNATRFPGVKMVVITPDVHYGYGVPVGCVLITDYESGAVAMGPVGYDIGCGMMSAKSEVPVEAATPEKRLQRIPVDDDWKVPVGGKGKPERGRQQLGSLGGGNHFIELQREVNSGELFVQVHTGSRGFGHGLATNYFELARAERHETKDIDLGYFTPDSKHYREYLNAVAAGGNYAILNRLIIFEQVAEAFRETFNADLELIYEISHNLVQKEWHPEFGDVWVHRKGATRAFPAGYPLLRGTMWEDTGHPILIPGSNKDFSYILRPLPGAVKSGFSVNHGAGRRMSRSQAARTLSQRKIDDEYAEAGILVNTDGHVPIDESAQCYKSSEEVVKAVLDAGLAEIQHQLWPVSSLKGTEEGPRWRRKKSPRSGRKSTEHF